MIQNVFPDDRLWSFSAHWLLLPERLQPPGPAGRQRVPHVLLPPVSPQTPVAASPPLKTHKIRFLAKPEYFLVEMC